MALCICAPTHLNLPQNNLSSINLESIKKVVSHHLATVALRGIRCFAARRILSKREMMNTKCKTKQIKIKQGEEAELYVCKSVQKCDGKHSGIRAVLTVVGPLKIGIVTRKRTTR